MPLWVLWIIGIVTAAVVLAAIIWDEEKEPKRDEPGKKQ